MLVDEADYVMLNYAQDLETKGGGHRVIGVTATTFSRKTTEFERDYMEKLNWAIIDSGFPKSVGQDDYKTSDL